MHRLFFLIACIFLQPAAADVTRSGDNGFITAHSVTVAANPEQVFNMLKTIGKWWNAEHSYSGKGENLTLDKSCFCERWDNSLVRHMDVLHWRPNEQIIMRGGLGPLTSLGYDGTMIWSLVVTDDNKTDIQWKYYVNGFSDYPVEDIAAAVDMVIAEQLNRLAGKF